MKEKLKHYLHWLRDGFMQMLRMHPVEAALILYGCLGCIFAYELECDDLLKKLALVPLFFALSLAVNNLAGRGAWRRVYWVVWTPIVPLSFWSGLGHWLNTEPAWITFGILAPVAVLMCRRAVQNERFMNDVIIWLRSGVLALLFANVALGLFAAIFYSTTYIFGLHGHWTTDVWVYALILTETFAVPVLFLMMADRWSGATCSGTRILDILLNYIVTPALLIYTVILYLYMAKILVTWSLPEGGVAYLVFGFTIFAIVVKAMQFLLQKRMYDWFFDRFSLVSLPTQVLFWIGVLRRTSEYGLTAPRVYLLVCGGLMTLCVLLFLSRRAGRYLYVCMAGFMVFAAFAYIPALQPDHLAARSQTKRAIRIAEGLERIDSDGRLILTPVTLADTVHIQQYHRLYESLDYIEYRDTVAFARFGVKLDDFLTLFPRQMQGHVRWGYSYNSRYDYDQLVEFDMPQGASFEMDDNYPHYYSNLYRWDNQYFNFANDTLRLYLGRSEPVHTIPGSELVRQQLLRSGFPAQEEMTPSPEQLLQLLDYRDAYCRILFYNIKLERRDSTLVIEDVSVHAIMTR